MALVASLVLLVVHVSVFWFYVADDAFISLRYVDRVLSGQGLTWTDGPAVEGYSNLLWVMLTALIGVTGIDLFLALRILSVSCGIGALCFVCVPLGRHSASASWVAGAAIAASTSVALWIPGGLEQPLVALCLAAALAVLGKGLSEPEPTARTVLPAALALSALCWTRPDSPILVAGLTLGWFLASGQTWASLRTAGVLCAIPALATLLQVAGRLAYYDDWVPNTAHVKVRPSAFHTDMGAIWTYQALESHGPLLLLALTAFGGPVMGERPRSRVRLALPVLGAWLAWTVSMGGDVFPAYRHFVPMVVVLAWLAGSGVAGLSRQRPGLGPLLALVASGLLGWMTAGQWSRAVEQQARNEGWVVDALEVGATLGSAFLPEQPLVAVSQAGAIPYASRLPSLDMIGLNDRHIGRSESVEGGWLGHDTGDGDYVFAKRPDIIFFRGPRGNERPSFKSEKELAERRDFAETYALLRWQTRPHHVDEPVEMQPWVRRSGALGPLLEDGRVKVPAWLLTEHAGTAIPRTDGRLVLVLDTGDRASGSVVLPSGAWMAPEMDGLTIEVVPEDRRWRIDVLATQPIELAELVFSPARIGPSSGHGPASR